VALLGVGLLGGSLGLALRRQGLAGRVHGYVRREAAVPECRAAGAVDTAGTDLAEAVREADLVVLCTPLGQMVPLTQRAAPYLAPGALVTDVGSVKAPVVRALEPIVAAAGARFVGSHPLAGSERTGVGAARADLFAGAVCVVTPTPTSDPAAVATVSRLWEAVGGIVLTLSPEAHDERVARTSHLPQALAATLAHLVLAPEAPPEQARLCAGGFRDGTRIASGSPEMWRDIFLANREPVTRALDEFRRTFESLRQAVAAGDAAALERFLTTARQRREAWRQTGSASPAE
jgi:prephenate dehydrogenase